MADDTDRIQTSRRLILQAEQEFDAGDTLQASEKAWGAVVHRIKAVAEERNVELGSHVSIMRAARDVAAHTDDPEKTRDALHKAKLLHVNFYDNDIEREDVQRWIQQVRDLLDAIDRVVDKLPMQGLFPSISRKAAQQQMDGILA